MVRGRPKIGDRLCVALTPELEKALADFALEHGVKRAEAARLLIERGLGATAFKTKPEKRTPKEPSGDCRHPVGRRIGSWCAECQREVGKR